MAKFTKKMEDAFNKAAEAMLTEFGATQVPNRVTWELSTNWGKVDVMPYGDWCALRFRELTPEQVAKMSAYSGFNRFSWKWNFQAWPNDASMDVDRRINALRHRLHFLKALPVSAQAAVSTVAT